MSFFHRPRIKQWGWVLLACLASFAAGNYHVTREAVDGSARWWQGQERHVVSVERRKAWAKCMEAYGG